MSVRGAEELRRRMAALVKRAEKFGKRDGRKDRGRFPREGSALPHYLELLETCQAVRAELLGSLDEARSHATAEKARLDHEIEGLEQSSARRHDNIDELSAKLETGGHDDEADGDLLEIKISQEKAKYEGDLETLNNLRSRLTAAKNKIVDTERQASQGEKIYSELEDVVMETYRASYRDSQSKRSILDMILRRG